MDKYIDDSRIHEGHRSRMKSKLFSHGQKIFDTYELLEMLLYHTIPYKDTNPVSKRLLYAFGGLDNVLSADSEKLTSVNGVGTRTADFLTKVGKLSDIIGAEMLCDGGKSLSDYDSVGEYLVDYFAGKDKCSVVGLFFDSSMRLLSVKKIYDLDYESGGVKPKAFIDEAVECRAVVVISAHNHPHGPFYPTPGDRATHGLIASSLSSAGFFHAEHYIISGKSYSGIGALKNFSIQLSAMPAVDHFLESRALSLESKECLNVEYSPFESADTTQDMQKIASISQEIDISNINKDGGYNIYDLDYFADLIGYVKPSKCHEIAETLLKKYCTIENTLNSSVRELISLVGESLAFYLKLLAYISSRRQTDKFTFGTKHSTAEIADYLKALYLGESVEETYLLTFDRQGAINGCHLLGEGTVCSSEVLPRKAVETAVSAKAKAVSIAHNHPFGNTRASSDDINMTRFFAGVFKSCDIDLKEHFIVAGQLCDTVQFKIDDKA